MAERISRKWTLYVHSPWFEYIRDGRKRFEGRLNKGDAAKFQPGDVIVFGKAVDNKRQLDQPTFERSIATVTTFESFQDALTTLPLQHVLPGVVSVEAGVAVYRKFSSEETEKATGVLMIELKDDVKDLTEEKQEVLSVHEMKDALKAQMAFVQNQLRNRDHCMQSLRASIVKLEQKLNRLSELFDKCMTEMAHVTDNHADRLEALEAQLAALHQQVNPVAPPVPPNAAPPHMHEVD